MENKSTKSVRARVLLTLLILILAIILGVFFVYRNNIKAVWRGLTTDTGDISEMIQNSQTQTKNALSDAGMNVSEDDFNKLNNGDLSQEEIEAIIYDSLSGAETDPVKKPVSDTGSETVAEGETPGDKADSGDGKTTGSSAEPSSKDQPSSDGKQPSSAPGGQSENASGKTPSSGKNPSGSKDASGSKPSGSTQTKDPTAASTTPTRTPSTTQGTFLPQPGTTSPIGTAKLSEEEYNKKVAELVAKIYVIKANFTSTLSAFESNIIASYKALPKEQHTTATKAKIVSDNMGYVTGLEAQCDAQIKAVTDELSALMKENGKDTSLVDAINSAYQSEKELKKAYYISLYK